jgi:hypothetical protein
MKRKIAAFFAFAAVLIHAQATVPLWENNGTTNLVVPIDAVTIVNKAGGNIFASSTPLPYDTSNTQNYTNDANATISGSVGFRFDTAPRNSSGAATMPRQLAANFFNRGNVTATDGLISLDLLLGFARVSYLLVHATNIVNQGTLAVGPGGLLQLVGTNMNVSRSTLMVNRVTGSGSFNNFNLGTFTPDVAVTDSYWGQTNDTFNVATIAVATNREVMTISNGVFVTNIVAQLDVTSPPHEVDFGGFPFNTQLAFTFPFAGGFTNNIAAYTNAINPTNIFIQAVFVRTTTSNSVVDIRFNPSANPTNGFHTVGVTASSLESNLFTGALTTNSIYFLDTLASTTNRGLLVNNVTGDTQRPANYILSRVPILNFSTWRTNNTPFDPALLFDPAFASVISDGPYAGYAATLDNLPNRPPAVGDYTNVSGRVEIRAQQLDMNRARIRAEGLLSIRTPHLINSTNAIIDSENLSYDLGSTNGTLRVQGLARDIVSRFRGDVYAWSAVWTNSVTPVGSTNTVALNFHVLMLDVQLTADGIPVNTYDFVSRATNTIITDNLTVTRSFKVLGETLTLNGTLTLSDPLDDWQRSLVPNLLHFTNTGFLNIANEAHFGDEEGTQPYGSFVNSGSIISYGQEIRSDYALITGLQNAFASFSLEASNGEIDGGNIFANGAVTLAGGDIRLNQAFIFSSGLLEFNVTNSLADNGGGSGNFINISSGLLMSTKPATGDLLGTSLITEAPTFAPVFHVWAGRDDGVSASGFLNNVALSALILSPFDPDPLFIFSGAGMANGLYVDLLDLSQLSDFENQVAIDPNLTIYYASAALSFAPGNGQTPEEYLDGQLDGRLRWVPGFAGPNSATAVTINGSQVASVNSAVRNSSLLDSDADGIVNDLDVSPFDGVIIHSIRANANPAGYQISWDAAPGTPYHVEVKTNLTAAWSLLFTVTSTNSVVVPLTVLDTNTAPVGASRYYRVSYSP